MVKDATYETKYSGDINVRNNPDALNNPVVCDISYNTRFTLLNKVPYHDNSISGQERDRINIKVITNPTGSCAIGKEGWISAGTSSDCNFDKV